MILHVIGIFLAIDIHEIHDPRRLYWSNEQSRTFPSMNFGEIVIANLQLSLLESPDQQVLDFLDAVNTQFKQAVTSGSFITLDKSMIKSFHHDLKGKIKIICKPRPIGNEMKNMSDVISKIVLHLELYEGRDTMCDKTYVKEFNITATRLQLTKKAYHGSGRRVIADSRFGSVKCAKALMERGLYSIMRVKTAQDFPGELLSQINLQRGEWNAVTAEIDDVELQACPFLDLQLKGFIRTCPTAVPGHPRKKTHHGLVPRPHIAEIYLKYVASIDIHNHVQAGSALEDV